MFLISKLFASKLHQEVFSNGGGIVLEILLCISSSKIQHALLI